MGEKTQRKQYPIIGTKPQEYIPWDVLAPHESRAVKNHCQTLEELAERGGLTWEEVVWILLDKPWGGPPNPKPDAARNAVLKYVAAWEAETAKEERSNDE